MAKHAGFRTRMAIGQGSAWGYAVEATKRLQFLSESVDHDPDIQDDQSLMGDSGFNEQVLGNEKNEGQIEIPMQYGGNADALLAAAMGASVAGTHSPTDYYQWDFSLLEPSDFFSLAIDKSVHVHEIASAMVVGFELEALAKGRMIFRPTLRGKAYSNDSVTNTAATMDSADVSAAAQVLMSHARFFFGDNANALDVAIPSDDEIKIRRFKLSVDWQMDEVYTNQGLFIPAQNNRRIVTVELGKTSLDTENWRDWQRGKTDMQLAAVFSTTVAGQTHFLKFHLGKCRVFGVPDATSGPEKLMPDITLRGLRAAEGSTTWATMTEELEIQTQNALDSNPLS